jgi:hypothetical protein
VVDEVSRKISTDEAMRTMFSILAAVFGLGELQLYLPDFTPGVLYILVLLGYIHM